MWPCDHLDRILAAPSTIICKGHGEMEKCNYMMSKVTFAACSNSMWIFLRDLCLNSVTALLGLRSFLLIGTFLSTAV